MLSGFKMACIEIGMLDAAAVAAGEQRRHIAADTRNGRRVESTQRGRGMDQFARTASPGQCGEDVTAMAWLRQYGWQPAVGAWRQRVMEQRDGWQDAARKDGSGGGRGAERRSPAKGIGLLAAWPQAMAAAGAGEAQLCSALLNHNGQFCKILTQNYQTCLSDKSVKPDHSAYR